MTAVLLSCEPSGRPTLRQRVHSALVFACLAACVLVNVTAMSADELLIPPPVPPEFDAGDAPDWQPAAANRSSSTELPPADDLRLKVPPPRDPVAERDAEPGPAESALDAARRRQEKDLRYQQLQDRLRRMITLWKEQELAKAQAGIEVPQTTGSEDITGDAGTTEVPVNDDPAPDAGPGDEAGAVDEPIQFESTDQQPSPHASSVVLAQQLAGSSLVEGPVDRIGLADNLYGMGEIVIALQMYDNVQTNGLSIAEKHWITFQTASCLRRLNRVPEAQERYRRLAGEKDAGWLAKAAMWWLDHIDQRSEVETQIRRYQELIDSIKEPQNALIRK